jgi:serine protease AprX
MPKYFIRVASDEQLALTMRFAAGRRGAGPFRSRSQEDIIITELLGDEVAALRRSNVQVFEDIEFEPLQRYAGDRLASAMGSDDQTSLADVVAHVRAPLAWEVSRGAGVTIAIVDTGICRTQAEFPAWKRSPIDLPTAFAGAHWTDPRGHGSMCAAIAAGTRSAGGRFDGIAPDATLLAARTTLLATDIYSIYDNLIDLKRRGEIAGPLVISNSYGLYQCSASGGLQQNHPYLGIILAAIGDGIPVVFAAGNNHNDLMCNHPPSACSPSTIWAMNSHDKVISVGTVDRAGSNQDPATAHRNSSRGPGEWAVDFPKPDCVAPTYGTVVWGCGYRWMEWWGTSGACPQVAGLAALMLSANPSLTPARIAEIIRATARSTGAAHECVGHGVIDCEAAVAAAATAALV